jgi:hypothetical protein
VVAGRVDVKTDTQAIELDWLKGNKFHEGIWLYLEKHVRIWAKEYGSVYVATGPIIELASASRTEEPLLSPASSPSMSFPLWTHVGLAKPLPAISIPIIAIASVLISFLWYWIILGLGA